MFAFSSAATGNSLSSDSLTASGRQCFSGHFQPQLLSRTGRGVRISPLTRKLCVPGGAVRSSEARLMGPGIIPFATGAYAVGLLAYVGLFVQLILRAPSTRGKVLLAAAGASLVWELAGLILAIAPSANSWLAYQVTDAARLATWLAFLATLLPVSSRGGLQRWIPGGARMALAVGIGAVLSLSAIAAYLTLGPAATIQGSTTALVFSLWVLASVVGLMWCEQLFRASPEERRWAIKPLCLGLAGMFGFDLFAFSDAALLRHLDTGFWAVRGVLAAMMIPLVMVATARNRDWTIDVGVSRNVVLSSLTLLLSGCYLLAVAGMGYYIRLFGGDWGRGVQAAFFFIALVLLGILFSSGTVRSRLRVFVSKNFFSYRYDYRQEWLRFTAALADDTQNLAVEERALEALANLVESPGGSLWLSAKDGTLRPAGRWNFAEVTSCLPRDSSLACLLARTGWVVDLRDQQLHPERYPDLDIPEWLTALREAWLVIPLSAGDALVGFALLARPRANVMVDWEVRDLLKTAARQAASFVGHVRAAEALVEAQKFEAFNRMSAFVVHDLKNLVAQLSLMMRNAERHASKPEFQKDMLMTVQHAVERMNRLLLQLQSGAAPVEKPRGVELDTLIQRVIAPHLGQSRRIAVDVQPRLRALGHDERLERVLGHLVQNAVDATRADGSISIGARQEGDHCVIDVKDDGQGMSPEFVRDDLFKPFRSTKSSGMGIGAYESQQYVSELGGRIAVHSTVDAGTLIRVYLPVPAGDDPDMRPQRAAA